MSNIIHIVEPKKLLLAWQAPDSVKNRTRWAVGSITKQDGDHVLQYFDEAEFAQHNDGTLSDIKALGFAGYPAFNYKFRQHSSGVIDAFLRRLPPRSRPDFDQYRNQFRISDSLRLSDFALLGITEAKLPSDGFSLVDPIEDRNAQRELFLEVAGYRHYSSLLEPPLALGTRVLFLPEPTNPKDRNAVVLLRDRETLGYINRHQAKAFLTWINQDRVSGWIERLNGTEDKPRAYVFVRVQAAKNYMAA
jgi:hypothetical protein